jgi:hypothetical protein
MSAPLPEKTGKLSDLYESTSRNPNHKDKASIPVADRVFHPDRQTRVVDH